MAKIKEKTESFVIHYPEAVDFTNKQLKIFWLPDEITVEKDVQDILTNMTEAEKHGVITVLRLFTLYELKAGADYWCGRFMRTFKRPELLRMASAFGMFELAVHKVFYNKINEALHLNTDDFYLSYVNDDMLKSRMEFIDDSIRDKDDLYSLAVFSMVEGAILYSSFAFLKHFQSKGKNKLLNIVRGINFSVRDEALHSLAGAWTFRTLKEEVKLKGERLEALNERIKEAAKQIYEHECRVVGMVFEKGEIIGASKESLKTFVASRLNACLVELGIPVLFEVKENPIATWFYDSINQFSFNDFFSGIGNSYQRDWDETAFTWQASSIE